MHWRGRAGRRLLGRPLDLSRPERDEGQRAAERGGGLRRVGGDGRRHGPDRGGVPLRRGRGGRARGRSRRPPGGGGAGGVLRRRRGGDWGRRRHAQLRSQGPRRRRQAPGHLAPGNPQPLRQGPRRPERSRRSGAYGGGRPRPLRRRGGSQRPPLPQQLLARHLPRGGARARRDPRARRRLEVAGHPARGPCPASAVSRRQRHAAAARADPAGHEPPRLHRQQSIRDEGLRGRAAAGDGPRRAVALRRSRPQPARFRGPGRTRPARAARPRP